MGASESTPTTNGNNQEEERKQESGGGSMGRLKTAAVASIAVMGVAALAISKMHSDNSSTSSHSEYESRYVIDRALPSPRRPYKMNTDGSCRPNQGRIGYVQSTQDDSVMKGLSGFGGILRDDRGKWVRGFMGFIGISDCLTSEIHGIHYGLLLLDKLDLKGSILESDSEAATDWIKTTNRPRSGSQVINKCWGIINECRVLVEKNKIKISWCSRDANKCAHELAKMAVEKQVEKQQPYVEIMDVPNELKQLLYRDSLMMCQN